MYNLSLGANPNSFAIESFLVADRIEVFEKLKKRFWKIEDIKVGQWRSFFEKLEKLASFKSSDC